MSRIDYDLSLIDAMAFDVDGVLSPSTIPLGADGMPARMVNIKDGYALQLAVKLGYNIAIISGGKSDAVYRRFASLGIRDIYMGASVKTDILTEWMQLRNLKSQSTAFVGDDIPDYQVMQRVGLSVAPADAASDIKMIARYISPVCGGYGVARDLIEQVLRAHGQWLDHGNAFGW